jgi:hypothetical protein
MARLAAQVPVRVPKACEGYMATTSRLANMEALLGQMVGTEHVTDPCAQCTAGSGVWVQCVTVLNIFTGVCANCHYGSEGTRCSFCKSYLL